MARPFELVKDINDTKELWKIAVRVHHKWTVVNKNKEHFEMLLCDKEGSDIHCRVPTMYKQAFDSLLTVNGTVTVSNFQVSLNDLLFKPSDHKFVLTFSGGTSVTDINKHEIPPRPLKFTPFADILTGKWKRDVLIDVIGMVSDIGYTQIQDGNKKQQINLVLKDLCNNILNCTLWEGYAMQFHDFNKQRKDLSSPIVIVLQFAKVKEEGKYPVCVSNTFNVTMLHINDDLAEIKEFLNRYKVLIEVFNEACKAIFVLWDRECSQLLDITAAQLRNTMLEAGITDPLDYPLALDGLVGLTMAFKVKWQPSLNNATVVSIYQDRSVINQLLHSWGQESIPSPSREADIIKQLTESVDEAVTNEDCTVVTDVDITSEHIPLPVTPTSANKRIAPPISNDNVASSEIPAGEQSSTKMKKIIKVEKLAP